MHCLIKMNDIIIVILGDVLMKGDKCTQGPRDLWASWDLPKKKPIKNKKHFDFFCDCLEKLGIIL